MGSEDVKVTAMNMYKYKEGITFSHDVTAAMLVFQNKGMAAMIV